MQKAKRPLRCASMGMPTAAYRCSTISAALGITCAVPLLPLAAAALLVVLVAVPGEVAAVSPS